MEFRGYIKRGVRMIIINEFYDEEANRLFKKIMGDSNENNK